MRPRAAAFAFLLVLAALPSSVTATEPRFGQPQATGRIAGIVRDHDGRPMPGRTVVLRSPARRGVVRATTGADGSYAFGNLEPARYAVEVEYAYGTVSVPVELSAGAMTATTVVVEIPPPPPLDPALLPAGTEVWVTSLDDRTIAGKVVRLSDDIVLRGTDGDVTMPFDTVRRIDKKDSNTDGALGGFLGGLGAGVLLGAIAPCGADPCSSGAPGRSGTTSGGDRLGSALGFGFLFGAIGAGIGAAIDNSDDGRQTVYAAPTGSTSWHFAPVLSRRSRGILLVIRR